MARVALVTGGTRGIGHAVVARLKADGFSVAAGYANDEETAKATADEFGVMIVKGNVGDFDIQRRGVQKIEPPSRQHPLPDAGVGRRFLRRHLAFRRGARRLALHASPMMEAVMTAEMKAVFERLLTDRTLQDDAYDPPFSDFNVVIDNHGTAINVTVPLATARIKFRYSAAIDPSPIRMAVREAAGRHGPQVAIDAMFDR